MKKYLFCLSLFATSASLVPTSFERGEAKGFYFYGDEMDDFCVESKALMAKLITIYEWFNGIADPAQPYQREMLGKYFTSDFIMQMNGDIIANSYESLHKHFEEFRKSGCLVKIELPPKEIIVSNDYERCIVHYTVTKTCAKKRDTLEVMAIWYLSRDGRFRRMNEVVHVKAKP